MKYSINIDQINSIEWGFNLSEAAVFTYLFNVPTWADHILINGKSFYFAARQKTCQDVPLISEKADTIYRIYKTLHEKEVIEYLKHMGKDCMRITEKGKAWNSEKFPNTAIELGNKSELTRKVFRKNSEINPTYKSTIDNTTNDKIKESITENEFSDSLLSMDEIEDLENQIYKTNLTQKRKKVAPKKEKPGVPTPVKEMFDIYKEAFASLNTGTYPEFMTKYCIPLQRLYGILDKRFIEKGLTKSYDLEPWEMFLRTYVDYLKNAGHKERWLRDNFDPTMILSNFNSIITKLLANKSDHDRNMDKAAEVMNYFRTHETKLDIL